MQTQGHPLRDPNPRCFIDPKVFGCAAPGNVPDQGNTQERLSKLKTASSPRKIHVTSKSPVGDISVVTLIRTDTTLDHSQKAEKVWRHRGLRRAPASRVNDSDPCLRAASQQDASRHSAPLRGRKTHRRTQTQSPQATGDAIRNDRCHTPCKMPYTSMQNFQIISRIVFPQLPGKTPYAMQDA